MLLETALIRYFFQKIITTDKMDIIDLSIMLTYLNFFIRLVTVRRAASLLLKPYVSAVLLQAALLSFDLP